MTQRWSQRLDGYIDASPPRRPRIPVGYLNTYTQLKEPDHCWGLNGGNDKWQHDVYNAGCLIEAGVHYYRATGKTALLKVAAKLANHMCEVIGPGRRTTLSRGIRWPRSRWCGWLSCSASSRT